MKGMSTLSLMASLCVISGCGGGSEPTNGHGITQTTSLYGEYGLPPPSGDPNACGSVCAPTSSCSTSCSENGIQTTCGSYGVCHSTECSAICSNGLRCDTSCTVNGAASTCGAYGVCLPPPDCLFEFYTDSNFGGIKDCFGTTSDLAAAVQNSSGTQLLFRWSAVPHNDMYSSFKSANAICNERGISPCRLAGSPYAFTYGYVEVYQDSNYDGKYKDYDSWSDLDFMDDHWYDEFWQGHVNDQTSSFSALLWLQ